jgi:hypothetical protein
VRGEFRKFTHRWNGSRARTEDEESLIGELTDTTPGSKAQNQASAERCPSPDDVRRLPKYPDVPVRAEEEQVAVAECCHEGEKVRSAFLTEGCDVPCIAMFPNVTLATHRCAICIVPKLQPANHENGEFLAPSRITSGVEARPRMPARSAT